MTVSDGELQRLPGFPEGINNVTREDAVRRSALRQAVNVNLTKEGKIQRRAGYTSRDAGDVHSLHPNGETLFAVKDGALGVYNTEYDFTALVSGISPHGVAYATVDTATYWTDGERFGRIVEGVAQAGWVSCPGQPALAAAAVGGLPAGMYQVAITYLAADGRESGSSLATLVTVPAEGGITMSNIPPNPDAVTVRVYVSGANDDVLQWAMDLPAGTTTASLGVSPRGKALDSQFLEPLPPGQHLMLLNGRLYVAVGNALIWSEPFRYGLWHPDNYAAFDGDIAMIVPAAEGPDAGFYLSTSGKKAKTYFIRGSDPKSWTLGVSHAHGAVKGSAITVPGAVIGLPDMGDVPYWLTTNGHFCYGTPDGRAVPLTHDRFVTPQNGASAATLLREENGLSQLLTSLMGGMNNVAAATDSMTATIRRHGSTT